PSGASVAPAPGLPVVALPVVALPEVALPAAGALAASAAAGAAVAIAPAGGASRAAWAFFVQPATKATAAQFRAAKFRAAKFRAAKFSAARAPSRCRAMPQYERARIMARSLPVMLGACPAKSAADAGLTRAWPAARAGADRPGRCTRDRL